jgi:hypothetical protein
MVVQVDWEQQEQVEQQLPQAQHCFIRYKLSLLCLTNRYQSPKAVVVEVPEQVAEQEIQQVAVVEVVQQVDSFTWLLQQ